MVRLWHCFWSCFLYFSSHRSKICKIMHKHHNVWFAMRSHPHTFPQALTWLLYCDQETDKDETWWVIKDLPDEKVLRVRNTYYPSGLADRKHVVNKVTEKIRTAVYIVTSNHCQHFVTEMLLGTGISDQARDHYLAAAFIWFGCQCSKPHAPHYQKRVQHQCQKILCSFQPFLLRVRPHSSSLVCLLGDWMIPLLKPFFEVITAEFVALKINLCVYLS